MRAGVLLLGGNKTFGRRKDKLLFRCILSNRTSVLVPYRHKHTRFQKHRTSKFVLVKPTDEKTSADHNIALLSSVIGDVDNLPSFYEYQLHAKGLWRPKRTRLYQVVQRNRKREEELFRHLFAICKEDRIHYNNIISVDPAGCKDIDDAFSLSSTTLSIYISNVAMWFHVLDLVSSPEIIEHSATVYLPNGNREMLPELLSRNWCSLVSKQRRPALVCDIDLVSSKATFTTAMIEVSKNFTYEDYERTTEYQEALHCVQCLDRGQKIKDSHELIAWLMIFMSQAAAQRLERGLFRGVSSSSRHSTEGIPEDLKGFLQAWTSTGGRYTTEPSRHEFLGLDRYVHITSPIRRLPDIVNGLLLQFQEGLLPEAKVFVDYWLGRVESINEKMKAIRRLQIQCELLQRLSALGRQTSEGYVVDSFDGDDQDCPQRYVIYFPSLKLVATYRSKEILKRLSRYHFSLVIFQNEETFKKKVRVKKLD